MSPQIERDCPISLGVGMRDGLYQLPRLFQFRHAFIRPQDEQVEKCIVPGDFPIPPQVPEHSGLVYAAHLVGCVTSPISSATTPAAVSGQPAKDANRMAFSGSSKARLGCISGLSTTRRKARLMAFWRVLGGSRLRASEHLAQIPKTNGVPSDDAAKNSAGLTGNRQCGQSIPTNSEPPRLATKLSSAGEMSRYSRSPRLLEFRAGNRRHLCRKTARQKSGELASWISRRQPQAVQGEFASPCSCCSVCTLNYTLARAANRGGAILAHYHESFVPLLFQFSRFSRYPRHGGVILGAAPVSKEKTCVECAAACILNFLKS